MDEINLQTELQDIVSADYEQKVGTVGTAPVTIQRTDNKNCTSVHIHNPVLGTRGNGLSDVIYVTVDGQNPTNFGETLTVGQSIQFHGKIVDGNIKISSNNAGTNYEISLVG